MGTTEEQEQLLRDKGLWHDWFENEHPEHEVTISQGFWLAKYEITQGQWQAVMGTTPWVGQDLVQIDPNNPAVSIPWNDVQGLINSLNSDAGQTVYRLPTEAEWEYACRAGTMTPWSFGDDETLLGVYAWYAGSAPDVGESYGHAVGTKLPNPWGLHDMHGNVWEYVQDWHGSYSGEAQVDPQGPSGSRRATRGGGVTSGAGWERSAVRSHMQPDAGDNNLGFRLLRAR
ncbi:formylglycine-generating enzyme family protein [Candidatus Latescibacterota bacterium]